MRPNLTELMNGINKTIMISAMPIAQQARDMKSLWELATASRLLTYLEDRWRTEFGRLAGDNRELESLLREAAAGLRPLDPGPAAELDAFLQTPPGDPAAGPTIDLLEQRSLQLKTGLERFLLLHTEMKANAASSPALDAVRQNLRRFLAAVTRRDFDAAQKVIFF